MADKNRLAADRVDPTAARLVIGLVTALASGPADGFDAYIALLDEVESSGAASVLHAAIWSNLAGLLALSAQTGRTLDDLLARMGRFGLHEFGSDP